MELLRDYKDIKNEFNYNFIDKWEDNIEINNENFIPKLLKENERYVIIFGDYKKLEKNKYNRLVKREAYYIIDKINNKRIRGAETLADFEKFKNIKNFMVFINNVLNKYGKDWW